MDARLRDKIAMAKRTSEFTHAHPLTDPGELAILARLDAFIADGEVLQMQQRSGHLMVNAASVHRTQLIAELTHEPFQLLVAAARAAALERPELASLFKLPPRSTQAEFMTAARGMLTEARANQDVMKKYGASDDLLAELTGKLDEFEATGKQFNQGRRGHVGARGQLRHVGREIMMLVEVLGAINLYRFKGKPEEQDAWKSARNIPWPHVEPTKDPPAAPDTTVSHE